MAVAGGGYAYLKNTTVKELSASNASDKLVSGRYLDNGNDTITDTQTKLMWKKCSEGRSGNACGGKAATYTWDDAMSRFKSGVSFADYNDWRMPTKDELKTLVYCSNGKKTPLPDNEYCGDDGTYQPPTINLQAFPNTKDGNYWFSTIKSATSACQQK